MYYHHQHVVFVFVVADVAIQILRLHIASLIQCCHQACHRNKLDRTVFKYCLHIHHASSSPWRSNQCNLSPHCGPRAVFHKLCIVLSCDAGFRRLLEHRRPIDQSHEVSEECHVCKEFVVRPTQERQHPLRAGTVKRTQHLSGKRMIGYTATVISSTNWTPQFHTIEGTWNVRRPSKHPSSPHWTSSVFSKFTRRHGERQCAIKASKRNLFDV